MKKRITMKKLFLSVLLIAAPFTAFSQLKVISSGKVAIGISGIPVSDLSVGGVGLSTAANHFESDKSILMNLKCIGDTANPSNSVTRTGLKITRTTETVGSFTGIDSKMAFAGSSNVGSSTGVHGTAGNAKINYGVRGTLQGNKNGAAIAGCASGNSLSISGQYAGYFAGDVEVTNDLYAEGILQQGDGRFMFLQEEIDTATARLEALTPLKWAWPNQVQGNDPRVYTHYDIPGQNLKEQFPFLVRESSSTYHYVNYVGLVPVLVQAVKELSARIAELENSQFTSRSVSSSLTIPTTSDIERTSGNTEASLLQNTPNPFSERTTIRFSVPDDATSAYIYIFDMTGKMQRQIPIDASMDSVTINGYELSPGMYIYSLVIGGKEVDTKRMILSK